MHIRFAAILFTPIFLIASLTTAMAADPLKKPEEFRGIRWGTPVAEVQGLTQVDRDGDIIHYDRSNEKMDLGGIPLRHVTYSFYKGRFYHAEISYEESGAFEALERSLEEKYGPPDTVREKKDAQGHPYEVAVWNWPGSIFIGNRHEKGSPRGRIFYFFAPLTDVSAKAQGISVPSQATAGQGATYTVKKGDTLSRVARQLGVSEEDLARANPGLADKKLKAGTTLAVPTAGQPSGKSAGTAPTAPATAETAKPTRTAEPATNTREYVKYTVKDGDVLSKVANAHGLHTRDVIAANPGINPDALRLGTVLRIPVKKAAKPEIVAPPAATPEAAAP